MLVTIARYRPSGLWNNWLSRDILVILFLQWIQGQEQIFPQGTLLTGQWQFCNLIAINTCTQIYLLPPSGLFYLPPSNDATLFKLILCFRECGMLSLVQFSHYLTLHTIHHLGLIMSTLLLNGLWGLERSSKSGFQDQKRGWIELQTQVFFLIQQLIPGFQSLLWLASDSVLCPCLQGH
jgi:hypothetical protein